MQILIKIFFIIFIGSEEQKQKYIPLLARGDKIGAFGLTEPDHGSNPAGMEVKARWDEQAGVYRRVHKYFYFIYFH